MKNALTAEALAQGFDLKELGDHTLELWFRGKLAARFSQTKITIEGIEYEMQEVMANERRN